VFAYVFGSIAAIVLGSGMSLIMTDLAALLTNLAEGDVLFIDEIHRLS
jgi:Holliday junction resolvasome RuvABC ATP-dependent DNA helicase subunit